MEKMTLLKSECVESLRQSIANHLDRYRAGDFAGLLDVITVDVDIDYASLNSLCLPSGDNLKDVENCVAIHSACKNLTPFAARDERFWTHLCHGPLLEYSRKRWPIPGDDRKAISSIRSHFFAGDKRNLEARNATSRLYWLAHMASRVTDIPLKETLSLILHKQDVRQNVIERPTVLQAEAIFVAVIKNLKNSKATDEKLFERQNFRSLQERLNEYCGYIFIESLPESTVQIIVDQMVSDILFKDAEAA